MRNYKSQRLSLNADKYALFAMLLAFNLLSPTLPPVHAKSVPSTASPVIGILTQPFPMNTGDNDKYMIAASYPKWLESAGARTIPVPYDADDDLVDEIFHQVNGFFITGGSSPVPNAFRRMWKLAMEANLEKGDYFPFWGTCLGFEYMLQTESELGGGIMEAGFDAENISWPLYGVRPVGLYSDPKIYDIVVNRNVTMNNHHLGVGTAGFLADKKLTKHFQMTSFSFDRTGRSFISTMEPIDAEKLPIYGVQYHPEKNTFEYGTFQGTNIPFEAIDHSTEGVAFSLYLAQFFVGLTRRNLALGKHQYTNPDKFPLIITYPVISAVYFEQIYLFPATAVGVEVELESKN